MVSKSVALLLCLPVLIYARISVDIVASENDNERSVNVYGTNLDIISDAERNTFGLNDNALKNSVDRYFGKRPDDAYLRSPTPWGDLYQSYNWRQVTRSLTPQKGRILSVTSQPTIVMTQYFSNNSSQSGEFTAKISQEVQNTVSSTWEKNGQLTVSQDIEYGFDIKVISVGGKTSFSYTSGWGQSTTKSETVTVGSESGVTITLEPKQSVIAELYATRGTMKIQVDYEASLSGHVAVNYGKTYKGHHFWALDVNGVMRSGDMSNSVSSREVIDIGYYTDSRVVIKDAKTHSVLYSMPMKQY